MELCITVCIKDEAVKSIAPAVPGQVQDLLCTA